MEKKGEQMKVILEEGERKKGGFTTVSSHEISIISEYKMGTVMRILDRGMRPSRVFKSQQFLAMKFVP